MMYRRKRYLLWAVRHSIATGKFLTSAIGLNICISYVGRLTMFVTQLIGADILCIYIYMYLWTIMWST